MRPKIKRLPISSVSGHERPCSSEVLKTSRTVFREQLQLCAVARIPIPRFCSLRISRIFTICIDLILSSLFNDDEIIVSGAYFPRSGWVNLNRNGGSLSIGLLGHFESDAWVKLHRNNQCPIFVSKTPKSLINQDFRTNCGGERFELSDSLTRHTISRSAGEFASISQ